MTTLVRSCVQEFTYHSRISIYSVYTCQLNSSHRHRQATIPAFLSASFCLYINM